MSTLITTSIPYVNAQPHIGFALELVIGDVLARHARKREKTTWFLNGTDDNSLKNALAAEAAGVSTQAFVQRNADRFEALSALLNISNDDFIRTSSDPRHARAVVKLWQACEANGDLYERTYEGLYCVGCEQFYREPELVCGLCPDHRVAPEAVSERNTFFRLSRYQQQLISLIESGELAIRPAHRRNEILSFLDQPLADLSVSRSTERARGWGIRVPTDASQVIYVWFDALANYISALGYAHGTQTFDQFWRQADQIIHLVGKGVTRFHAVYWPAILLSAGLRVPTDLWVHGYLTIDGQKISKSLGNTISPWDAQARFGTDPLRYYLLRHIGSHRDGDFNFTRFDEVYESELANQFGNLLARTIGLLRRYGVPAPLKSHLATGLATQVDEALERYELHDALQAIWLVVGALNVYVSETAPWALVKSGDITGCEQILGQLLWGVQCVIDQLEIFLPATAARSARQLVELDSTPLFPK